MQQIETEPITTNRQIQSSSNNATEAGNVGTRNCDSIIKLNILMDYELSTGRADQTVGCGFISISD